MKCPRCQQDNPAQARFCLGCGARLALACASCGTELPGGARFCLQCGHAVAAGTAASVRSPAPETYTPKHLAEKILTSKAALEGERKQVTVLFADLKGSMELLADRDPEEARKLLDPVLERMMEAVHRYEGTVNQVMGDGIMALFGAPLAHEDHAVRACYAALLMQESVKRYAEEARHAHGVNLQIRVGLNSGEVVVRAIGSDLHMDYTAVGQTTHLAARMEQLASPGSILLTASTLELVEGFVAVKPLGPVPVKGLADAVEVYDVTGAGPARTRLQAAARRGLTRFVGRDVEVEQLRRAQQLAANGHGQIAAIVGEAGVGKSRLVYELTHSHRLQGWLILEAASVSYGKATSYLPAIDLLKGYFKIQDRDDLREIREKVTGKLLTLDRALEPTLPALLALLDVPVDDAAWQTLDPAQRRQRTLDGVKRLLLRETREQPLLLIFEDLHWIDIETQALLDSLVETLGSARVLLLVNYRPEYQHAWGGKTYYSQMRLDALPAGSAGELLDALLGADPALAPLKQLLVKRGNPFFLEETIRTLVETKTLAGERGRYRLTQPITTIQIPATVQTVLAARIDRLAPEHKRLLQTASVVGKDVPFVLLQAIADLSQETLHRGLEHLQTAEFLYETGLYPDLEYSFKHALTHEVTYGGLLQERRRELHARIVDALERLHEGRLAEHTERLAYHAVRGEIWDQAVVYLRQAGAAALFRSLARQAVACFEQALTALHHLPESRTRHEQAIDIRIDLRTPLFRLGELRQLSRYLHEAATLAENLGDPQRLGLVSALMAHYLWISGDVDLALPHAERAIAIADANGDGGLRALATGYLGFIHFRRGDYPRGLSALRAGMEAVADAWDARRSASLIMHPVFVGTWCAWCHAELGAFAEGMVIAEELIRKATALDQPFPLLHAHFALGLVRLRSGDVDQAIPVLERGLEFWRVAEIPVAFSLIAIPLGLAYTLAGRVSDAIAVLERAVGEADAMGMTLDQSLRVGHLSEAYLLANRLDDAMSFAMRSLELARRDKERGNEAWALRLLGEVLSRHDPLDSETAEGHYRQAMTLAAGLSMRPLVAHCHLGLGTLYRRTGKREQAQEHLTTATTMCREMDMLFWLEQAEAEMAALR